MSTIPSAVRQQAEKAAAMINQLAGQGDPSAQPQPQPSDPGAFTPPVQPQAPAQPQPPEPPSVPSQVSPDSAGQEHDWKKRFSQYKAHADQEIARLREQDGRRAQQMQQLQEEMQNLRTQLEEAKQAGGPVAGVPNGLLTADEVEAIGLENLGIVQRVVQAAVQSATQGIESKVTQVAKTQEQLEAERAQAQNRERQMRFEARLDGALTDWRKADSDPGFELWMQELDPLSGRPRGEIFNAAYREFDVERVASFYRTWLAAQEAPDPRLTQGVVPPSAPQPDQHVITPNGRIWSRADIKQFYKDRGLGKYTPEEGRELELDIFAAQREGRVR